MKASRNLIDRITQNIAVALLPDDSENIFRNWKLRWFRHEIEVVS